ncbi:MAG: hypothetical protein Kow0081_3270 [Candidatus Dojkabacteria bacterium]
MYEKLRKLQDADIKGKTVVVRVNYDVPLSGSQEILDVTRIESSLETIKYLHKNECKIVLVSHLGRPGGEEVDELSLMPVRFELGKLLNMPIKFAHINACENSIKFMEPQEIILLENLRFHKGEESSKAEEREEFIKVLSDLCDVYVNEAFGVYREHASVFELAQSLPSYAGFEFQKEIEHLSKLEDVTEKPYIAVIGGKKMDTKIPLLKHLVKKVDKLLIGGAMAYTFLKAQGVNVGKSLVEDECIKDAKEIFELAKKSSCEIILPVDHICSSELKEDGVSVEVNTQHIPDDLFGLDIGPRTLEDFREIIEAARTILWNGPMGVFEWEQYNRGTEAIGEYIALAAPKESFKVAGGADTTYAINLLKIKPKRFNHISIGGGMMLKFLSGQEFKVINVLCD